MLHGMQDCFAMTDAEALAVFTRSGVLRIVASTPQGPLLRTVDGVVLDGELYFHGADRGEKLDLVGREVMVSSDETVAHLPSWFFDERRACPATTYYRSVFAWGRLERVEDSETKAAVLRAMMDRLQPEGGYQSIEADDPLYASVIEGLLVARIRPTRISGKAKLGQHKGERTIVRALEGLWRRGAPGDLEALRAIREAHPARPMPAFMRGPGGRVFEVAPDERELGAAVALVADAYWNEGITPAAIGAAHRASPAWVVARDADARVVATARAVGDDVKNVTIYDVAVDPEHRGCGLGQVLVALLLDHPRVARARRVLLQTRDAHGFYAKLGFGLHRPRHDSLVTQRSA